jgi:hypothetical protein
MAQNEELPFIDYFVVCGLPQNAEIELQKSAGN